MIRTLLIANRGEIAVRIIRTAKAMGIRTVAVYSDADRSALHVEMADEAFRIGAAPALESYLDGQAILAAAEASSADAIHPGYGFLSENPDFAEAVEQAGLVFVGPPPRAMRLMGLKAEAKRLMRKAGVPVVPGYEGDDQSPARLAAEAEAIGFPVLLKPVAGGGGRGMRLVSCRDELDANLAAAQREATSAFGDGRVLVEKHLPAVRHIEVQVMADSHGNVIHLWERDCSAQRRHQKVIEEAPAPGLPEDLRLRMCEAAVKAARQVGYVGAGTVEFLVPVSLDGFYFIEMNTRLQVEHPVTELITGLDLVALQLRVASGEELGLVQENIPLDGHAIEARLYAEDPAQGFRPQTGEITQLRVPQANGLRFDGGVREGDSITAYYDAMIGKLIAHGPSREAARARLARAIGETQVTGLATNLGFLARLLGDPGFVEARVDTQFIDRSLDDLNAPLKPPLAVLGVAALAMEKRFSAPASPSPFHHLRGFALWGSDAQTIRLRLGSESVAVLLEEKDVGFSVTQAGETLNFSLLRVEPPHAWIETEGRVLHLDYHDDGEAFVVTLEGDRYHFSREKSAGVEESASGNRSIVSPVPGLLAKLIAPEGGEVQAGDIVAVVEAMKTEFALKAEAEGTVTFLAREGAQVKEGEVIAEIGAGDG